MPAQMRWSTDLTISVEPLTPVGFSPFGTVVQNPKNTTFPIPPTSVEANQGSAIKYSDVSPLVSLYDIARSAKAAAPRVSMFSCKPRRLEKSTTGQQVFKIGILERHPFTPQTFIPLGLAPHDLETAYLVIVAPTSPQKVSGVDLPSYEVPDRSVPETISPENHIAVRTATPRNSGPPDLAGIKAFIARGDQAVTYGAGTWHAPMVVLGKQSVDFVVVQYTNGVAEDDCQEVEISGSSINVQIAQDLLTPISSKL